MAENQDQEFLKIKAKLKEYDLETKCRLISLLKLTDKKKELDKL